MIPNSSVLFRSFEIRLQSFLVSFFLLKFSFYIQLAVRLSSHFILFHFHDFNLHILEILIKLEHEFLFVDRILLLFLLFLVRVISELVYC